MSVLTQPKDAGRIAVCVHHMDNHEALQKVSRELSVYQKNWLETKRRKPNEHLNFKFLGFENMGLKQYAVYSITIETEH